MLKIISEEKMEASIETEKKYIEQCVEDTIEAIVTGRFSVESLKKFHRDVNEKNRRIAHQDEAEDLDGDSLLFMHQVTKKAVQAVGTQRRLNAQRARRSMRLRNSVVE